MSSSRDVEDERENGRKVTTQPEILVRRDCYGGERIIELRLPRGVEAAALDRLGGAKTVLDKLPRPFFRVDVPGKYLVSGILGDAVVRFTVRLAVRDHAVELALSGARVLLGETA